MFLLLYLAFRFDVFLVVIVTSLRQIVPLSRVLFDLVFGSGWQSAFCSELFVWNFLGADDLREDVLHLFKSTAILTSFLPSVSFFFQLFRRNITFHIKQPLSE